MRRRGVRTSKALLACLGGILAFLMIATAQADFRTVYGDGQWHDMGGGWYYAYNISLNDCYWAHTGVIRFAYDYDAGQWWDYRTSWGTLGAGGISTDAFIGNGGTHSLNNGWYFTYNKYLRDSYFSTGSAVRYAYDYDGGQWWHYGISWSTLGASGLSQSFVGDGVWHNLGDGWSYAYNRAIDDAYWGTGSAVRFSYDYDGGRWWHNRTSWYTLGASGVSQSFVGDGAFHNLNDGWLYAYNKPINDGYWNTGTATRFSYDYDGGQWWHYGISWSTLGASGLSQSFVGDQQWHNLGNGWNFLYEKGQNRNWWNIGSTNQQVRFLYDYDTLQWCTVDWTGTFWQPYLLGAAGVSQHFIGDGTSHSLNNGWFFAYNKALDDGYWNRGELGGNMRFSYDFDGKWWWDLTVNGWGRLGGTSGMSSSFIGDGGLHTWLGGDGFWYHYSSDTYYWRSGGVDRYRYNFSAQTWEYYGSVSGTWYSLTYGGTAQNPDCRYLYNGLFVERGLYDDQGLYAPVGRKELRYSVYNPSDGWTRVAQWFIHRAGSDNNWSGGDLNIAWGITREWNSDVSDYVNSAFQRYGEYTAEDVIFFAADFVEHPIGFAAMVDWMTWVRDYYGTQIRTVQVAAHGNAGGWQMGQWMDTSNFTSFQSDWQRWGNLMTADGQLVSLHCSVGNAVNMLNTIAGWSGMDIFANTNVTWTVWWWIRGEAENPSNWNYNYRDIQWWDNSDEFMSRLFEYTTTGSQNYRWLFQY